MIDGTKAVTEPGVGFDGARDEPLGGGDGIEQAGAFGQSRRNRCGEGAAGPVRVRRLNARARKGMKPACCKKQIGGVGDQVASFDQHRFGSEVGNGARGVFERGGE